MAGPTRSWFIHVAQIPGSQKERLGGRHFLALALAYAVERKSRDLSIVPARQGLSMSLPQQSWLFPLVILARDGTLRDTRVDASDRVELFSLEDRYGPTKFTSGRNPKIGDPSLFAYCDTHVERAFSHFN